MTLYATLDDVKGELLANSTVDDAKIMRLLRQVSRRIDTLFRSNVPLFAPSIQTRRIALSGLNVNSTDGTLLLNWPLLSLAGLTINSTAFVVGTTVQAYPVSMVPYPQLQLIGDTWYSWYTAYCSDVRGPQFATVTGVWGYHADYANAWLSVDALAVDITSSATTLTVADVDGTNPYGDTPRISAGNLLQIDSEWMDVTATNTSTNVVTVRRGVNGSTAASHTTGAAVTVFQVDENIRRATVRQTAFQYARQGMFESRRVTEFTSVDYPKDLLEEVQHLLQYFANL
jgi:hypothetical protein